jgi:hypothetical protein
MGYVKHTPAPASPPRYGIVLSNPTSLVGHRSSGMGDVNSPNFAQCGISGTVDVSDLVNSEVLVLYANPSLTGIVGLDKMTVVKWLEIDGTGLSGPLDVSANTILEALVLGGTGVTQVTGLAGNTHFTNLYFGFGSGLTALNVTGCTGLVGLYLPNNTAVATVTGLSSCSSYIYFVFQGCGQDQTWVDGILHDVDNSAAAGGSLDLTGNTAPSAHVLTHVASLTAKVIYVTVDP